jgi:hypothetical protein
MLFLVYFSLELRLRFSQAGNKGMKPLPVSLMKTNPRKSGRGGELLSNRPEDQEIAVLALHLIQVSLALINTLLLQEVLAEDTWKASMKPEDWRGLTPLFYQHVNPYGRFTLDLTQRLPLSLTNIA